MKPDTNPKPFYDPYKDVELRYHVPNGAKHIKKESVRSKRFYGPYEHIQLRNYVENRYKNKALKQNSKIENNTYKYDNLKPEDSMSSRQRVSNERNPKVSEAFQDDTWSDQWIPIIHWTLEEYYPYNSYSYYYHKM